MKHFLFNLSYCLSFKPTDSIARTPAIDFLCAKIFSSVLRKQPAEKPLIVCTDSFITGRQSGAIQIFSEAQSEGHFFKISFFYSYFVYVEEILINAAFTGKF